MKPATIDRFFAEMSKRWTTPTSVIVTGGCAALLLGGTRPTDDIDYEVSFETDHVTWESFSEAVRTTQQATGLDAQFSESIDRWSQVSFLDYREHTLPYKRFGSIDVAILDPIYWSIGKISRYWDQDVQDLVAVFSNTTPAPAQVASLWAQAIKESPASNTLFLVKKQARHFFTRHGKRIWGKGFDPTLALGFFD